MSFWLRNLMDRYEQLSVRERLLVLAALLAVILVIWDGVFMGPRERERKQRGAQVQGLAAEVSGLEQSIEAISAQGVIDPNEATRKDIEKLRKEIPELDAQLAGATSGLIDPKEMSRVLEQLLARTSRLQLRALRTLPPAAVVAPASTQAADAAAGVIEKDLRSPALALGAAPVQAGAAQIYKHGLELELTGTYLDILRFLQALESLQWRFFWDRIEFSVEEHPRARVKLTLYTLSLQEGWIGV